MGVNLAAGQGAAARTQGMYLDLPCSAGFWLFLSYSVHCIGQEKIFFENDLSKKTFSSTCKGTKKAFSWESLKAERLYSTVHLTHLDQNGHCFYLWSNSTLDWNAGFSVSEAIVMSMKKTHCFVSYQNISISSMDSISRMQSQWNKSLCIQSWLPSSILFQSKPRHLLITLQSNCINCCWCLPSVDWSYKGKRQSKEVRGKRKRLAAHKSLRNTARKSLGIFSNLKLMQDVIAMVIADTKKPEKKKDNFTVEAWATQTVGSDKLYYGVLNCSFLLKFCNNDELFIFDEFGKYHKLSHNDTALKAIAGCYGCEWTAIAKHIAREHPKLFGSELPTVELTRAALSRCMKFIAQCSRENFLQLLGHGYNCPCAVVATKATVWTVNLLCPLTLGAKAAAAGWQQRSSRRLRKQLE